MVYAVFRLSVFVRASHCSCAPAGVRARSTEGIKIHLVYAVFSPVGVRPCKSVQLAVHSCNLVLSFASAVTYVFTLLRAASGSIV